MLPWSAGAKYDEPLVSTRTSLRVNNYILDTKLTSVISYNTAMPLVFLDGCVVGSNNKWCFAYN